MLLLCILVPRPRICLCLCLFVFVFQNYLHKNVCCSFVFWYPVHAFVFVFLSLYFKITFIRTSAAPLYSGTPSTYFMDCSLVFIMSTWDYDYIHLRLALNALKNSWPQIILRGKAYKMCIRCSNGKTSGVTTISFFVIVRMMTITIIGINRMMITIIGFNRMMIRIKGINRHGSNGGDQSRDHRGHKVTEDSILKIGHRWREK